MKGKGSLNSNPAMGFTDNSIPNQGMPPNFDGHHGMEFPGANQQLNSHTQSSVINGSPMNSQRPMDFQTNGFGMIPGQHPNHMEGGAINGASGNYPGYHQGNRGSHH